MVTKDVIGWGHNFRKALSSEQLSSRVDSPFHYHGCCRLRVRSTVRRPLGFRYVKTRPAVLALQSKRNVCYNSCSQTFPISPSLSQCEPAIGQSFPTSERKAEDDQRPYFAGPTISWALVTGPTTSCILQTLDSPQPGSSSSGLEHGPPTSSHSKHFRKIAVGAK